MKRRASIFSILLLTGLIVLALIGSCEESPTTVTISVYYDQDDRAAPPAGAVLYIRMMEHNGTLNPPVPVWSNESAPYAVSGLVDGSMYRYVLSPPDSILTDPGSLYMFDAYFYSAAVAVPPISPIDGGDVERFTLEAIPVAPVPQSPYYEAAPHLNLGMEIHPGDQKHIHLTAIQIFP